MRTSRRAAKRGVRALLVLSLVLSFAGCRKAPDSGAGSGRESGVLELLGLEPSAESLDYVANKTQFQLHTLLTEQRHPKTWNLSETIRTDTLAGLRMLSAVDEDIKTRLEALAADTSALDAAAAAVETAILSGRKIYIYGCGATGRLAKQMESSFWRPFWRRALADAGLRARLAANLPAGAGVEAGLIGEMTGADRALISSLEGFEDLQLIGRLQLRDRGITKGDVVICVTEGGETSSVIGTILAAHAQWAAEPGYDAAASRKNLYFVYNNPDERLRPFERSRRVLDEPGITKINLTTGPQAITGSTRMQATTIETCVVGTILETGARRALGRFLAADEMAGLGFAGADGIGPRLGEFAAVLEAARAALPYVARLTDIEAAAYAGGRFSTYFAMRGLITVFIDSTERSPTFRLYPLDTVNEPARKCWIQVWTGAETPRAAWQAFLGRPFRGLEPEFYRKPFETEIDDAYLRRAALESLKKAGDDQQDLYDFSLSPDNLARRGPKPGDLGVAVVLAGEESGIGDEESAFRKFMDLFAGDGLRLGVLLIMGGESGSGAEAGTEVRTEAGAEVGTEVGAEARAAESAEAPEARLRRLFKGKPEALTVIPVRLAAARGGGRGMDSGGGKNDGGRGKNDGGDVSGDPFGLKGQIAAKMLLNAHSTAVMAKLGKVVGNTMTNVSPSNLKLIGRATYLIQSHVNDALGRPEWIEARGRRRAVTYGEANAVLFDSIAYLKDRRKEAGQTAEVAFSIVRILESLKRRRAVPREEALSIVHTTSLSDYLRIGRIGVKSSF